MKKSLKVLLIVFMVLVGIQNVNALDTTKGAAYTYGHEVDISVNGLTSGGMSVFNTHFSLSKDGVSYPAVCLEAYKPANMSSYYVASVLGDSTLSEKERAIEYGLMEILAKGYNVDNTSFTGSFGTISGNELFIATSTAARAYATLLTNKLAGGTLSFNGDKLQSGYATAASEWAAQYALADVNKLLGTSCTNAGCLRTAIRAHGYYWYDTNAKLISNGSASANRVYNAARELFLAGVEKAISVLNGEDTAGNGQVEVSVKEISKTVIERTADETQEYININADIANFTDENYLNNFQFVCNNCSSSGITYNSMEYYNENNEWVTLTPDVDISKVIEPNEEGVRTGTIKIRIHITKLVSDDEDECNPANYNVTYQYYDPSVEYVGIRLDSKTPLTDQQVVILDKVDAYVVDGSLTGTTPNAGTSGDATIDCAEPVCDTSISVPICSDDENEAISEVIAPEQIKKCILDNVDDAGNDYRLVEDGIENDYCEVFCKEDYKDVIDDGIPGGIKLNPEVNDVECGGFFQLTSHIEGQKDCYTGGDTSDKRINKEKYAQDIIQAQRKMIEGYDKFLKAEAAMNTITSSGPDTCGCIEYSSTGSYAGFEAVVTDEENGIVISQGATHSYSYTSSCKNCDAEIDEEGNITCNPSCTPGTEAEVIKNIEKDKADGISQMESGYETYKNVIKAYNGCTAAWSIEFPFEQRLKFFYTEYHYEDQYAPYYDIISRADDAKSKYYLEAQEETLKEETEVEICKSSTSQEYECEGDAATFDSMNVSVDEWNYAAEYGGAVYTNRTFTICDESGCESDDRMISDATFIRKSIKKAQDYITPTVFYQIEANGKITVNEGYVGDKVKLDALINSLPVSTSTTGGGLYQLLLEDLGEFYNPENALDRDLKGRLIDFEGGNEEKSVAVAIGDSGIKVFDGEYTCHYYSPCRPKECPDCDFVCDEEGCTWGPPGSCPNCVFECVNCVFDLDELQLNFKPISTTDFNSSNREPGYNWLTEESASNWEINTSLEALELLMDKAELTINEIEEENETIYDKTGDDSQLNFSIRMTNNVIDYLKEYNKEAEKDGGYANDSLTCYSATIDGKQYANIFCYSEVIDELVTDFGDLITVKNRTPEGSRSDENNAANSSGYWSLWDWEEPARDVNGQYAIIGGPSWK